MHQKIVVELNQELGKDYSVAAGDETFVHVTKRLEEDSKTVAIKTILKFLGLKENQVAATFGGMPMGNDAGLFDIIITRVNFINKIFMNPVREKATCPVRSNADAQAHLTSNGIWLYIRHTKS